MLGRAAVFLSDLTVQHSNLFIVVIHFRGAGRCLGLGGGELCSFRTLNDVCQMKLIMACMRNNIDAISIYCLHEIS